MPFWCSNWHRPAANTSSSPFTTLFGDAAECALMLGQFLEHEPKISAPSNNDATSTASLVKKKKKLVVVVVVMVADQD